jgi:hypothetical protein
VCIAKESLYHSLPIQGAHNHVFLNLTKGYADALTTSIDTPVPAAMCLIPLSYVRFPSRSVVFYASSNLLARVHIVDSFAVCGWGLRVSSAI